MSWGNSNPRVVKHADRSAHDEDNRPTMHGSKAEWRLMSGTGALIHWGLTDDIHVTVSGEGPDAMPEGNRRP